MSLAARLSDVVTPQIDDWVRQSTTDIHARLVRFDPIILEDLEPDTSSSAVEYPRSVTVKSGASSMAPALIHQSNASLPPPSLRSYCASTEATPTETSISTGLASQFTGVRLLEDNNGVLEIPRTQVRRPVYECAFWFLSCGQVFIDKEDWEIHCLSHFRGEEPPQSVQCPLCDWATTQNDGQMAWSLRMQHVAHTHTMNGETLRTSRPDFKLFQYLWQRRLIDDQDLKELKGGNHNLTSPPGNFVETNGRSGRRDRDGRRHRSQHVSSVRQVGPRRV